MTDIPTVSVPCNGCVACCKSAVALYPENGDDPKAYESEVFINPLTHAPGFKLKQRPNGECVYLGPEGCTIHDRAPSICRNFDCRVWYKRFPRKERRKLSASGALDWRILDEGRKRVKNT